MLFRFKNIRDFLYFSNMPWRFSLKQIICQVRHFLFWRKECWHFLIYKLYIENNWMKHNIFLQFQKAQKNYRRLRKLKIKHWKFYLNLIKKFKIDVLKKKNYHFTSTSTTFCIHCFKKFEIVIDYPIILFPVFNPNMMENIHMIYFSTPIKYY